MAWEGESLIQKGENLVKIALASLTRRSDFDVLICCLELLKIIHIFLPMQEKH